jgi:amyloid beta precursor protein binding protein 1
MGGVASQEVIKLITHQYIPMDNTFIFDGARSVSGVFSV